MKLLSVSHLNLTDLSPNLASFGPDNEPILLSNFADLTFVAAQISLRDSKDFNAKKRRQKKL